MHRVDADPHWVTTLARLSQSTAHPSAAASAWAASGVALWLGNPTPDWQVWQFAGGRLQSSDGWPVHPECDCRPLSALLAA